MRPDHGGRLELKLTSVSELGASFEVAVSTPGTDSKTQVRIAVSDGAVEFDAWDGEGPPPWLRAVAHALLRTLWRAHQSDGSWPRRVTRWRPDPRP